MSTFTAAIIIGPAVTFFGLLITAFQVIRTARINQTAALEANRLREAEAVAAERARQDTRFDAELARLRTDIQMERNARESAERRARDAEMRVDQLEARLRRIPPVRRPPHRGDTT